MADHDHANRVEQLEDLRNVATNADFYEKLAAGKLAGVASGTSPNGVNLQYIPVPITLKAQLGSPSQEHPKTAPQPDTAHTGDFLAIAGIGMVITAQWELVLGNTYAYTVLGAFGFFYFGFGLVVTPLFGVAAAYGGSDTAAYNNAIGFFVLLWACFNFLFLIGSLPLNIIYIGIFLTVQLAFTLVSASYFATADGNMGLAGNLKKAGGAFGFASGMLGYYTLGNLMCQEALRFSFPMGDTSRFFRKGAGR
ncbi:MAG: hypothetical protein M1828_007038 [Chrysothrix sp. TS-e1954]|nr:MAG: hypothetical protein M1828_007038 [Chrysothrix sp. TS-e1954]